MAKNKNEEVVLAKQEDVLEKQVENSPLPVKAGKDENGTATIVPMTRDEYEKHLKAYAQKNPAKYEAKKAVLEARLAKLK